MRRVVMVVIAAAALVGCGVNPEVKAVALRNRDLARRFVELIDGSATTREQEQEMLRQQRVAWEKFVEVLK